MGEIEIVDVSVVIWGWCDGLEIRGGLSLRFKFKVSSFYGMFIEFLESIGGYLKR